MASKPGRKPTSGTRHGNGKGWGGPAKGAAGPARPPSVMVDQTGHQHPSAAYPSYRMIAAAEREDVLTEHLWNMAFIEEKGSDRINATIGALNRIGGMPVARVINADASEPGWFIQGAIEAPTREAWTQRAKLLTDKPAGHGDD